MKDTSDYSTQTAREAAERGELGDWVAGFLSSAGSDNAPLAARLSEPPRWWLGPVQLPFDQLRRLAGPPGDPVLQTVDDDEWRDDVDDLARRIEGGLDPPPVVVTHRDLELYLEDGNHRIEALRRAGRDRTWAVLSFDDPAVRDHFIKRSEADQI